MAAPRRRNFSLSRRGHEIRSHSTDETIASYEAVLKAIREDNLKAAGAAMRAHLDHTERDIRTGINAAPATSPTRASAVPAPE